MLLFALRGDSRYADDKTWRILEFVNNQENSGDGLIDL